MASRILIVDEFDERLAAKLERIAAKSRRKSGLAREGALHDQLCLLRRCTADFSPAAASRLRLAATSLIARLEKMRQEFGESA